jgi:hypothetical protein
MSNQGNLKTVTTIRKVARIWSVIVFLVAALVIYGETAFPHTEEDYPPIENLLPFLMFLSVASLGLTWRRELLGGVLNISFFVANFVMYWIINGKPLPLGGLMILSLVIVPGILFIMTWAQSRRIVVTEP